MTLAKGTIFHLYIIALMYVLKKTQKICKYILQFVFVEYIIVIISREAKLEIDKPWVVVGWYVVWHR